MKLHQALVSHLQKADDSIVIELHNEHADDSYKIYTSIEDIADRVATDDPLTIARKMFFGDVESWYSRYFSLDGYGNIFSFGCLTDARCPIDFDWLADAIIEAGQFDAVGFDADKYGSDDDMEVEIFVE